LPSTEYLSAKISEYLDFLLPVKQPKKPVEPPKEEPTTPRQKYVPAERLAYLRSKTPSLAGTPRSSIEPEPSSPIFARRATMSDIENVVPAQKPLQRSISVSTNFAPKTVDLKSPKKFAEESPKRINYNHSMKNLTSSSGVSLATIFVATCKHLFETQPTVASLASFNGGMSLLFRIVTVEGPIRRNLAKPKVVQGAIIQAFQEYPGSPELEFIYEWIIANNERILIILEEKTAETCLSFLILDLLNYFEEELRAYQARRVALSVTVTPNRPPTREK
jgi:hypothetical protein